MRTRYAGCAVPTLASKDPISIIGRGTGTVPPGVCAGSAKQRPGDYGPASPLCSHARSKTFDQPSIKRFFKVLRRQLDMHGDFRISADQAEQGQSTMPAIVGNDGRVGVSPVLASDLHHQFRRTDAMPAANLRSNTVKSWPRRNEWQR